MIGLWRLAAGCHMLRLTKQCAAACRVILHINCTQTVTPQHKCMTNNYRHPHDATCAVASKCTAGASFVTNSAPTHLTNN